MPDEYRRFWITSRAAGEREFLLALAFEAGAEGAEEVEGDSHCRGCVYAPSSIIENVRRVVREAAAATTEVGPIEPMPNVDWSEAWKDGIEALRVSSRLVVRPPFIDVELEPGQKEVVIDPGQAFGTGGHASTRLCLEWIDALYADSPPSPETSSSDGSSSAPSPPARFDRVLDAGTGSGVLAFAALRLGAESALGFDLDPVAIEAAIESAKSNGLADRVRLLVSSVEELEAEASDYPLVVANLLKREVLPIASGLAARMSADGRLVLAGLLEEDGPEVVERFAKEGLVEVLAERRTLLDATGTWIGLCLVRADTASAPR